MGRKTTQADRNQHYRRLLQNARSAEAIVATTSTPALSSASTDPTPQTPQYTPTATLSPHSTTPLPPRKLPRSHVIMEDTLAKLRAILSAHATSTPAPTPLERPQSHHPPWSAGGVPPYPHTRDLPRYEYTRQDVDQLIDEITGKFQGQIATYQKALLDVAQATEHNLTDRRGHEHDLAAQLQQTQTLLAEAKAQLHIARTTPPATRELQAKLQTLELQLEEQRRVAAEDKKKRLDAESREKSATSSQSQTAKAKHELQVEKERLSELVEREKARRIEAESKLSQASKQPPGHAASKELATLRTRTTGFIEGEKRMAEQMRQTNVERDRLLDKQRTLRRECDGLRLRVKELTIERQGEEILVREKAELKKGIDELRDKNTRVEKENRAALRKIAELNAERRRLKEDLAEANSRAVINRDSRRADETGGRYQRYRSAAPSEDESFEPDGYQELYYPSPRTLADIPALTAASAFDPPSYTAAQGQAAEMRSASATKTLAELSNGLAPNKPVDPYASLDQAFGAELAKAQAEGGREESRVEGEPSLLQTASEPPQPSEWDKMYKEVTMQV